MGYSAPGLFAWREGRRGCGGRLAATDESSGEGLYPMKRSLIRTGIACALAVAGTAMPAYAQHSVAREWNNALLDSIRNDFARPTVHARNLYHVSAAMWDAWAAYDDVADQVIHDEKATADDIEAAREEAISYAAYRIIQARFGSAPGADVIMPMLDQLMDDLGYDKSFTSTVGDSPAALGNRIAVSVLSFGLNDGANEQNDYANKVYEPVNEPLVPDLPGNPNISDPNRWQPLALDFFIDQSGNVIIGGFPDALSPEWGEVTPFALGEEDLTLYHDQDLDYTWWVYHDPGLPPLYGEDSEDYYRWGFEMVAVWSSHCDPADGVMWDISPNTIGNSETPDVDEYEEYFDYFEGGDWSQGYEVNPVTGEPYEEQIVPRGDYARILAEFWADGPDSETPPGHWFTILNYVSDHPELEKRLGGEGPILDDLEWDVKTYLAMGGAMHDCAVAAWGVKGFYDYIRPISALRFMADLGQRTDPDLPGYHPDGIDLIPGYIEVCTEETTAPGEKHEHLAGNEGKIAFYAWRGPDYIVDPETDVAGVGWILAENWWPYQRPSFVTPPFPGYVSGHSTYSRGAAVMMELMTGSPYFPAGLGEFEAPMNEFLVFEDGPSVDVSLQWASYKDASDQTSLSRIWGGIHPPADDLPGRLMGEAIAPDSWELALDYFNGYVSCPVDINNDESLDVFDFIGFQTAFQNQESIADCNEDNAWDVFDFICFQQAFVQGCDD